MYEVKYFADVGCGGSAPARRQWKLGGGTAAAEASAAVAAAQSVAMVYSATAAADWWSARQPVILSSNAEGNRELTCIYISKDT